MEYYWVIKRGWLGTKRKFYSWEYHLQMKDCPFPCLITEAW